MDYLNDTEIRNRNLYEILSLNQDLADDWEIIKRQYRALDIDKVKIDGNTFTNYGDFQFIWEMSYVTEPKRSGNGSIGNLNSYAVFLTPHLILNFSLMSIDDYRHLMQLHYSIREHVVECYDPIYNRKVKVKMYFGTEQMAKLHTIARKRFNGAEWEDWIELVGVREYSVDLIGTNNDLDLVSVSYHYNLPPDTNYPNGVPVPPQYEQDVYMGEEIVIGANSTFKENPPTGFKFKRWIDKDGTVIYADGQLITVNQSMELYAVWETTTECTLAFNYGLANPVTEIDPETGVVTEIHNRTVQYGIKIGRLPIPQSPVVKDSAGREYYPYTNGNWYKVPVKSYQYLVESNIPYWSNRNDTIYYLYDKVSYEVKYITNADNYNIESQYIPYGETVWLPVLAKDGYNFGGWYIDSAFKNQFTGKMPPYNITLYAKWVKK